MVQIVHMCTQEEWQAAQGMNEYQADSLTSEGFIHFSKPEQAVDTANRYYAGWKNLVLLWVDPEKLKTELKWETSHGAVYPHLYGPLNLDAVLQVTAFLPDADGVFRNLPPNSASGL